MTKSFNLKITRILLAAFVVFAFSGCYRYGRGCCNKNSECPYLKAHTQTCETCNKSECAGSDCQKCKGCKEVGAGSKCSK